MRCGFQGGFPLKVSLVLAIWAQGAMPAWSQSASLASISGRVTDPSGALLVGVEVTVKGKTTGIVRKATTDQAGLYRAYNLVPGTWVVSATRAGFASLVWDDVALKAGQEITLDLSLKVGAVETTVTVQGGVPLVNLISTEIGTTLNSEQISQLPLNGRNWQSLGVLAPGVLQTNRNANLSFNGGTVFANNVLMDGANATRGDLGGFVSGWGQAITPQTSPDMIQEIRIDSANMSVRSGRGGGNTTNVITKSGSNEFHGTISYNFRNDKLDARNFFAARKAPFRFNQGGGTIGGPIVRNRTFFFAGVQFESDRVGFSTVQTNIPTQNLRDRFPSVFKFYIDRTPLPTEPQFFQNGQRDPDFGAWRQNGSQKIRNAIGQGRIDHHFSDKDSAYFRYQTGDSLITGPAYHAFNPGGYIPVRVQNAVLSETHVFSPNLINEFRLGFNRVLADNFSAGSAASPIFNVGGVNFFQSFRSGIDMHAAVGTISENLTFNSGRHTMSAGFEFTPVQASRFGYGSVGYNFNNIADFVANRPLVVNFSPTQGREAMRYETYAPYFSEEFRITPRFNMVFGIRYEYNSVQRNADLRNFIYELKNPLTARFTQYGEPWYKPNYKVIDPRVGLTYRLTNDGKTVFRAAYGRYHSPMVQFVANTMTNEPRYASITYARAENPGLAYPLTPGVAGGLNPLRSVFMIEENIKNPYTQNWNANIQRELPGRMVLEVGYVGTHFVHGYTDVGYLNLPDPTQGGRRPNPNFGQVNNFRSFLYQHYNGLQTALRKQQSHGLSFDVFYTWSHTTDNGTQDQGAFPNNPLCTGGTCDKGNGGYDVRHNIVSDFIYELPFGQGKGFNSSNAVVSKLTSGWRVSGILQTRTGLPFTVRNGSDRFGNTIGFTQRPNAVVGCDKTPPGGVRYPDRALNINCFALPPLGTYGNLGVGTERGPGLFNLDVSLAKRTALTEKKSLEFRAEFFNLPNKANFGNPSAGLSAPSNFGRIFSTVGGNMGFGGQRQIQFNLKLLF